MRIAFVTDELPAADMAGHLAVNHKMILWLRSLGHEVIILMLRPRLRQVVMRSAAAVAGNGVRSWRGVVFPSNPRAIFNVIGRSLMEILPAGGRAVLRKVFAGRRFGKADAVLEAFLSAEDCALGHRMILQMAPDAIFVDTIFRAGLLRNLPMAAIPSVIIAHDVFHRRHQSMLQAGFRVFPPELTRETEAGLLNLADVIAAIQPDEAAAIQEMCPEKIVCSAPMPAQPRKRPAGTARISNRLVFVGSAAPPNLHGLRWLFAEIWPRLSALVPDVSLDLVGDCGKAFPLLPANVRRLGRVGDLSPILHRAALAISPLRVGSGLKIKILDYASHGLFTVATPESLEGFAADENAPFIAAGDAKSFVKAVVARLLEHDPAGENRALAYIATHYNSDACFSGLAAALGFPAYRPFIQNPRAEKREELTKGVRQPHDSQENMGLSALRDRPAQ